MLRQYFPVARILFLLFHAPMGRGIVELALHVVTVISNLKVV